MYPKKNIKQSDLKFTKEDVVKRHVERGESYTTHQLARYFEISTPPMNTFLRRNFGSIANYKQHVAVIIAKASLTPNEKQQITMALNRKKEMFEDAKLAAMAKYSKLTGAYRKHASREFKKVWGITVKEVLADKKPDFDKFPIEAAPNVKIEKVKAVKQAKTGGVSSDRFVRGIVSQTETSYDLLKANNIMLKEILRRLTALEKK